VESNGQDQRSPEERSDQIFLPPRVKRDPANVGLRLTHLSANRAVGAVCEPSQFDGVLVVPASTVGAGRHVVSVDLAQTGQREVPQLGNRLVDQRMFKESVSWVVVTL